MDDKENINAMVTVIVHNITEEQKALIKESGEFNDFLGVPMGALVNIPLELTERQAEYLQSVGIDLEIKNHEKETADKKSQIKDARPLTNETVENDITDKNEEEKTEDDKEKVEENDEEKTEDDKEKVDKNEEEKTEDDKEKVEENDEEKTEEEKVDIFEEKDDEKLTPKQQEVKVKYMKTRAMEMLQCLDAYKKLDSATQYGILMVYDKATNLGDIKDPEFLNKKLPDAGIQLKDSKQLHMMVLGGLKLESHIEENRKESESIEEVATDAGKESAEQMNQKTILKVPKLLNDLDPYMKAEAEMGARDKIKKYIEMATTGRSTAETLIVISDIDSYFNKVKEEAKNNVEQGSEDIVSLFLSQNEIKEIPEIMKATKEVTDRVNVTFDDVNWKDPTERKAVIALIENAQDGMDEIGAQGISLVDNVSINFEVIDDWGDIQALQETCKDLGDVSNVNISASIEVSSELAPEQKEEMQQAADIILAANGIENENKLDDTLNEITEEIITNEVGKDNALNEISGGASCLIPGLDEIEVVDEIMRMTTNNADEE